MTVLPVRDMTAEEPYRSNAPTSVAMPLYQGILWAGGPDPLCEFAALLMHTKGGSHLGVVFGLLSRSEELPR